MPPARNDTTNPPTEPESGPRSPIRWSWWGIAAVVYLAHLSDEERMFVTTLVFSKLVTWMRGQPGTGDLRALAYMDEVAGYVPPTAAPPAKKSRWRSFRRRTSPGLSCRVMSVSSAVAATEASASRHRNEDRSSRSCAVRRQQGMTSGEAVSQRRHKCSVTHWMAWPLDCDAVVTSRRCPWTRARRTMRIVEVCRQRAGSTLVHGTHPLMRRLDPERGTPANIGPAAEIRRRDHVMTILDQTDALIQRDILEEFAWDPEVELARVGVSVVDGIVTLSGTVDSYPRKLAAERAALRIQGVRAVASDLVVAPGGIGARTDAELARTAIEAIEARRVVPPGEIRVAVEDGRIILEGEVLWAFQRAAAERFLSDLRGVREIDNRIAITPMPVSEAVVKERIEQALIRHAEIDAERIRVHVEGDVVHLSGTVPSWSEKRAAEDAAWKAKGVARVVNPTVVSPRGATQEAA